MIAESLPQEYAERAALYLMISHKSARGTLAQGLKPESFSAPRNEIIFQAISTLHNQGREVDHIICGEYLKSQKTLRQAGGWPYLADIVSADGGYEEIPSRAIEYVHILRQYGQQRLLQRVHSRLESQTEKGDIAVPDLINSLKTELDNPDFKPWQEEESSAEQIALETLEAYEEAEELSANGRRFAG